MDGESLFELTKTSNAEICIVEAFYGGSHKQLIDLLQPELELESLEYDLYTLPDKKWHWKARCSALHFSQKIAKPPHKYKVLFASSVLNLTELIGLRPDLAHLKKVIYFHENQLTYPVQKQSTRNKNIIENKQQRDFQYGYNQILTSLTADMIVFNSLYNKTSFLNHINTFLKMSPDKLRVDIKRDLEPKCSVLYFPLNLDETLVASIIAEAVLCESLIYFNYEAYLNRPLSILWPHRWEHDKNPEEFFSVLMKLDELKIDFYLHVVGENYNEIPDVFQVGKARLERRIISWGFMPSKMDYYKCLSKSDLVISTSLHEFYGVAVIEACLFGAYPLLPNRLVYPELFPAENLYSTEAQLIKKLKYFCTRPKLFRLMRQTRKAPTSLNDNVPCLIDSQDYFDKFKWKSLKTGFISLFR